MPTNITAWLNFALQQMAAESYLDGIILQNEDQVRLRLGDGNNDTRIVQPDPITGELPGKTRFTNALADRFLATYDIVDHHANDATGFSATLMRDTTTGEYTLSFRSLEYQNQAQGGDWERDGQGGAAGEIAGAGFALGQLVSMERYYEKLKNSGTLPAGATLNVTGYSLGGHLATVFTELHSNEINHTYIFNGAGVGQVGGVTPVVTEEIRIKQLIDAMDAKFVEFDPSGALLRSGASGSIYPVGWYQQASVIVTTQFQTTGTAFLTAGGLNGGVTRTDGAFSKITQLFGSSVTGGDRQVVANSGVHGPVQSILIEGQPLVESLPSLRDYGNAHSITLIVDSLALQALFESMDPDLTQADIENILKAASPARADVTALAIEEHTAEGDTLERALDALRALFVPNASDKKTDFNDDTGGFGDLGARTEYYAHLAEVAAVVANQTFSIEPLVQVDSQGQLVLRLTAVELIAAAQDPGDSGLAYRYALRALNPFAVVGADYVGLGHATDGQLALYDPGTGLGEMTDRYLADRADFLLAHLDLALANFPAPLIPSLTHYTDVATGTDVPSTSPPLQREYLFGSSVSNTLKGSVLLPTDDHLYGGGGADELLGYGGNDYLQGDSGDDRLDGGVGSDTLNGGLGRDIYVLNPDGTDTIEDSDRRGVLYVNEQVVVGGLRRPGEVPDAPYTSLDGQLTFVQTGGNLVINDHITITNWQPGDLGITLRDFSSLPDGALPVINYANGQPTITWEGDANDNTPAFGAGANHVANGFGGNDWISLEIGSVLFNHQIFGGTGHDWLLGGQGQDRIFGEQGSEYIGGGGGDDVLYGGTEKDVIHGDNELNSVYTGNDYIDGGPGDDGLNGDRGSDTIYGRDGDDDLFGENVPVAHDEARDYLDGGSGNDYISGALGDDVLIGGDGDDRLFGDNDPGEFRNDQITFPGIFEIIPSGSWFQAEGGADYMDGGQGVDELYGHGGHDVLLGGTENDKLYGDGPTLDGVNAGLDLLDGGAGDDLLYGGGEADTLLGGDDNDTLFGDFLDDPTGWNDLLDGGAGNDTLAGGRGDDMLFGGGDLDVLLGNEGQDLLDGGSGNDELRGGADADVLWGGTEDDQLFGEEGNDTLFGGEGFDILDGGSGDDVLVGGAGIDTLIGGAGADTYVFNFGDGVETIQDASGEGNRLVFGPGISADDISVGIGSLVVRVGLTGDAVHIEGFDPAQPTVPVGINTFEFADGTTLTQADLIARGFDLVGTAGNDVLNGGELYRGIYGLDGNDTLSGGAIDNVLHGGSGSDLIFGEAGTDQLFGETGDDIMRGGDGDDVMNGDAGNDLLEGGAGADVLVGGAGDDQLLGGSGADTYRFNLGDGIDGISDPNSIGEESRVVFGAGITSSSVTLTTNFGQVLVRPGAAFEGVTIGTNGNDVLGPHAADRFEFADGSSITYTDLITRGFDIDGTDFDDFLFGTNVVDRVRGGLGNDRLEGGAGNDSYFFNLGDGVDTVFDAAAAGAANEVVFGPGTTSSDLRLDLAPDQSGSNLSDLLLRVGNSGDAIQLDTFDRNNVFGARTVETFRFADGSTLTYDQLMAGGFDLMGTEGDDQIAGTNVVDRIVAGAGADVLRSGQGDDQLDGGAGDDRLIGGQGNDTYVFGPGAGQDTIVEFQGSLDTIRMAPGVAPSDVAVTRNNNDLVFSLNGGADRLTVSLYFLAPPLQIELVQFADGTVWDHTTIENLARPAITGTGGPDVLTGTSGDDRLVGLGGDDQLTGLAGNDHLDGGTGADLLTGGLGDDTYVIDEPGDLVIEGVDEGTDTIQSSVTVTLPQNVENLTLTGSAAINGTGNDMDNVLTGNSAANALTGGVGNDTYRVGAGDTVVELAGEGTDTVEAGVSTTLGANVENLTLVGSASLTGTGNELDNVLQADGSISILAGGEGDDTYLIGPNGDDDLLVETPTGGIDTVIAAHDYRLLDNIENLTMLDARVPDFGIELGFIHVAARPAGVGIGNELNNTLIGGQTANVLDGGAGADTMIGGAGDDIYVVDHSNDVIVEQINEGTDTVRASANYVLSANVENLRLAGTGTISGTGNALNNTIIGNDAANVLDGGAGNDWLQGFGGADTYVFSRGTAQDTVFDYSIAGEIDTVQFASDVAPADVGVYQRPGDLVLAINGTTDELTLANFFGLTDYAQKQVRFADGTVWNEAELRTRAVTVGGTTNGTTGNDNLVGGVGHDVLVGDAGNDVLTGGRGNDWLYGDAQTNNSFFPVIGNDTLQGGAGDDILRDFQGTNLFDGGTGNDTLYLGTGQDTVLFGRGSGVDLVTLDNNGSDLDIIQMGAGVSPADVVMTRSYPDYHMVDLLILDTGDQLTVTLSTNYPSVGLETTQAVVRFADGTEWNLAWSPSDLSFATGTQLDDVVSGFPGEVLRGLAGNDTYLVGVGSGPIVELPGEGTDTVQSTVDFTLPANVEHLSLADNFTAVGSYANNATGNALDNLIIGNTRDNVLDGGAGNDVLVGGLFRAFEVGLSETGSDLLIGGAGDDVLMADGGNVAFYSIAGFEGGESRDDVVRQADDLFIGGIGNDTYLVHSQEQTVAEFANEGTDTVEAHVSYALGENIENLTLVGAGSLSGTGNGLDNVLIGNEEGNVLDGREGNDTLWGGSALNFDSGVVPSGNDTLRGAAGHDTYLFNLGDGIDTIEDVATAGEGNRIQFGAGISRNDLTATQDEAARTLTIQVGASGTDKLMLTNFDPTNANGSLVVEMLALADGSQVSLASLLGPSITIFGTANNDVLVGTSGHDGIDAGAGNDTVYGNVGDDLILAGAGDDVATGDEGADTLSGGSGTDYLYGGDGNDILNGEDGNDVVVGDAGNDVLNGGAGNDVLNGGAGADQLNSGDGDDTLYIDGADTVVNGGAGYDAVTVVGLDGATFSATAAEVEFAAGSSGNDVFTAVGSLTSVTFYGGEGNDQLTGGAGNDVLAGQTGSDLLTGGLGNDILNGGEGDDVLTGEAGHDAFYAGAGNDLINGGDGDDSVSGEDGADTLSGGSGTDYLYGGDGDDVVNGDDGNDVVVGDAGNDVLSGGAGNDVLNGGAGADQLNGGDGDDTLYIDGADTIVSGGTGYDAVTVVGIDAVTFNATAAEAEFAAGSSGNDVFTAVGSPTGVTFYGGEGNDQLMGGDGNDVLVGQAGDDTLIGGLGADILNGSEGDDVLNGEAGNDTFYGGTGGDQLNGGDGDDSLAGDEGADTLLGGSGRDYLYGGEGNDVLTGEDGNDVLAGNTGNDAIAGGLGDDYLAGGTGNDQYTFARGDGADTISEDDATAGNSDGLLFGNTINPLDLVVSRQANDLRLAIHGTGDQVMIENWYLGDAHQVENVQAGNGQTLLNTQVDQLIQAMAAFSQQSGLTWDQAIDQRPQDMQTVLAASWQ